MKFLIQLKRNLGGYKEKDVDELINYSKQIKKENIKSNSDIQVKDKEMKDMNKKLEKLNLENAKLKDGRAIKERDDLIEKQKQTIENQKNIITEKNGIIEALEKSLEELTDKFKEFKKNISIFCNKICKALGHKLGIHFREDDELNYDDMEYYADKVNYNYERPKKDKSDDFEISM